MSDHLLSNVEQVDALRLVSTSHPIRHDSGDVAALVLSDTAELCCVVRDGGYDLWTADDDGQWDPTRVGLSLDTARTLAENSA